MVEYLGFVQRATTPNEWVLATHAPSPGSDMVPLPRPDISKFTWSLSSCIFVQEKSNQILGLRGPKMI